MKTKILISLFIGITLYSCIPDFINPVSQKTEIQVEDQELVVLLKKPNQEAIHSLSIKIIGVKPDSAVLYHSGNLLIPSRVLKKSNNFSSGGDWYSDSCFLVIHSHLILEDNTTLKYSFNY